MNSKQSYQIDTRNPMSVINLIDSGEAHGKNSLVLSLIALGGVFVDAYDFSSLSIGTIQLQHEMHLAGWELGLISSAMAFSAVFGALVGGHFVDKIGRLKMFLLDLYFFVISAVGASLAPNLAILIFFRLMMGLGAGLDFPVALSFVAEFSPAKIRGRFVNLSYVNWYIAAIAGYLFTYIVYELGAGNNLWRYAVGFGAVPALIILVLRYKYMEESPMWAAHRRKSQDVINILKKSLNVERVEDLSVGELSMTPHSSTRNFRQIFSSRYAMRTLLASSIAFTQSIEYFAVIFYLPIIAQMLFGHRLLYAILGGMFFSFFGVIGSISQAWICDRTGIRKLALVGYAIAGVSLPIIGLAHGFGLLPLAAVFVSLFLLGHSLGPGPQGMAMAALSFPTMLRGSAIGWTQGMLRVGSIVGSFAFPLLLGAVGFNATFQLLMLAPLAGGLVTLLIRWEPIGKPIEEEWCQSQEMELEPVTDGKV